MKEPRSYSGGQTTLFTNHIQHASLSYLHYIHCYCGNGLIVSETERKTTRQLRTYLKDYSSISIHYKVYSVVFVHGTVH